MYFFIEFSTYYFIIAISSISLLFIFAFSSALRVKTRKKFWLILVVIRNDVLEHNGEIFELE